MNAKILLLIASSFPATVMAQGCDVITGSQSQAVAQIETHSCYEYQGVPDEAIRWSCSNEDKGALSTQKKLVQSCNKKAVATCKARLTQEALANPKSTSEDKDGASANMPDDAQVTRYYYDVEQLQQAQRDCETTGGSWKNQ